MATYLTTSTADPTGQGAAPAAALVVAPQQADFVGLAARDLIAAVLSGLGLSWQSAEGELPEGDFSPPEAPRETTFAFVLRMLNEGAARAARAGGFLVRDGQQTLAATAPRMAYQALSTVDGSVIWHAQAVTWTPTGGTAAQLVYMGRERLLLRYGTAAHGWPVQYWCHDGENGIRLADAPATDGTVGVTGWAVPPPLQSLTDYPGWLSPDLARLLTVYAQRALCLKSAALAPRLAGFDGEWAEGVKALQAQARAENPDLWAFVYGGA